MFMLVRSTQILSMAALAPVLIALGACGQKTETPPAQAPQASTVAEAPKLPISIDAAMVGVVDHASDFLFAIGNGDLPKNDREWDLVRDHAYQMVVAGQVIKMQGTGANDAKWVADPGWQKMSDRLTEIGLEAVKLADAKQTQGWDKIGNDLVDQCLACHEAFKPDTPSQKILHSPTKRESEGKSVFDRD
jgi:predicted small lipoprotein YifL